MFLARIDSAGAPLLTSGIANMTIAENIKLRKQFIIQVAVLFKQDLLVVMNHGDLEGIGNNAHYFIKRLALERSSDGLVLQ